MTVRYGQKGYSGSSMSNRAREAYENGEMPKSKWTKSAMINALSEFCDGHNVDISAIEHMTKDQIFQRFFECSSWHHTSKFANTTYFYTASESLFVDYFGIKEQPKKIAPADYYYEQFRRQKEAFEDSDNGFYLKFHASRIFGISDMNKIVKSSYKVDDDFDNWEHWSNCCKILDEFNRWMDNHSKREINQALKDIHKYEE